jgi:hypothetical protein
LAIGAPKSPERECGDKAKSAKCGDFPAYFAFLWVPGRTSECLAGDAVHIAPVSKPNSLQTGNLTGKITISGLKATTPKQETTMPQGLFSKFPKQIIREFFLKNREF